MTEEQQRLGARLIAFAALWSLLSGLLLVLSLVVVALAAFAALLVAFGAIGAAWLLRRYEPGHALAIILAAAGRAIARVGRRLRDLDARRRVQRLGSRFRESAAGAPSRAGEMLARALRGYAIAVYWSRLRLSQLLGGSERPTTVGRRRRAFKLNELGVQLRRQGDVQHAAEQHRVALEIVRDLGDEQAEALTLNSLALALAHGGAEAEAVEHLEHARTVLHQLGDEEHEGQVIANLGLVYRRQGENDEAAVLFQEALNRLPPESSAYRRIEDELRRAG